MIRRTRGEVITATVDPELMASSPTLPFLTEAAYARRSGTVRQVLIEAERVEAGPPPMFPASDFYDMAPLAYDAPAVTLTTLRDVLVRGRSHILTTPDAILRHDLVDLRADVPSEVFYRRLTLINRRRAATWSPIDPFNVGYLPEAAAFTDATAFNYAHWMTEVLPRIVAFARRGGRGGTPLLVDTDLHPNLMRSLVLAIGPDTPLHLLAPEELVRVGVLHNISPTGYVPFSLRKQTKMDFSHGVFGPTALREMAGALRRGAAVSAGGEPRPKLFIRRKTSLRRLVNEDDIEAALVARGFIALEPEHLSLEAQIAVYSNAAMVVGATGAAITNLIFCRPDCPTVVLMPRFRQTAYWYWRRIAAAAGAGVVLYAVGEQVDPMDDLFHPLAAHNDFRVEVKDVLDAVEAAEALRR